MRFKPLLHILPNRNGSLPPEQTRWKGAFDVWTLDNDARRSVAKEPDGFSETNGMEQRRIFLFFYLCAAVKLGPLSKNLRVLRLLSQGDSSRAP